MTGHAARKAAIDAYKNREPKRGIFCIRCVPTGRRWVGAAPDLDAVRNQQWFLLSHGSHRNHDLQAAWQSLGEQAFEFVILETLDKDVEPTRVNDLLKQGKELWADEYGAETLLR
jgi:hypothetical protein